MVLFKSLTIETEGGDPIGGIAWQPLLIIVGSIAVFGLALPHAGHVRRAAAAVVIVSSRRRRIQLEGRARQRASS